MVPISGLQESFPNLQLSYQNGASIGVLRYNLGKNTTVLLVRWPVSLLAFMAAIIYIMTSIAAKHGTPLYHSIGLATLRIPTHAQFCDRLDFFVLFIQAGTRNVLAQILDNCVFVAME